MSEVDDDAPGDRSGDAATPKARTPPYIAYSTFKTLLSELKTNGLPPQIDRSVLARFAGGLQGQIMHALKTLDLIDDSKRPTPKLANLVTAHETPSYGEVLRPIIAETYPFLRDLDLMTATPSMFADAFKQATNAQEEVLRKCRTFFLHAVRDIGVPVGPRIEKAKFPRSRTNAPRKAKAPKADPMNGEPNGNSSLRNPKSDEISDKALEYKLIDLMREEGVDDAERNAIWTLVQYLTAKAKKKATDEEPAAS
jgi:hypothetical protein